MRRGFHIRRAAGTHMNGNEEELVFYVQLGRAITAWAHVEFFLGEVLSAFAEKERGNLQRFWELSRFGSFRKQLCLVHKSVGRHVCNPAHLARWRSIQKRCDRAYGRRNALAHRVVVIDLNGEAGRLVSLIGRRRGLAKARPEALYVRNTMGSNFAFTALSHTLHNFSHVLAPHSNRNFARCGTTCSNLGSI